MYRWIIRPILFRFDPETVHHFTFRMVGLLFSLPGVSWLCGRLFTYRRPWLKRTLMGITFENPVGMAAGMDKNALLTDEFAQFGFGFIEIGTITPLPQPGNDRPRLFRLTADRGIINRMGFNNDGAAAAADRLARRTSRIIIGGNIGKNKSTPNEDAFADYRKAFELLYPVVDYFVVNVSSPNTPGLRELQEKEPLRALLGGVKELSRQQVQPKHVLLKIAPDLTDTQLDDIIDILTSTGTDGVIATNTTISREGLHTSRETIERIGAGGWSGAPLRKRSTDVIRYLRQRLGPQYPIIGVGGIMSADDALEKLEAGADLIQLYTGFVYEGPGLVKKILKSIPAPVSR
ncbi:MAG: quinone-dependent dihydroorotate dehydrogenase [Bacteroidota bacterium]